MKKKLFACLIVAVLFGQISFADTEQSVTIDGVHESKFVKELVFNDNQVTLIFEDGLSTTADLESVNIALSYTSTMIEGVEVNNSKSDRNIYSIDGKRVGGSDKKLGNGVYVRNGKKFTIKK